MKTLQAQVTEKDKEISQMTHRIELLQDSMRHFTSLADKEENDQTFEAVLKGEFEAIEQALKEKNQELTSEVKWLRQQI